MVIEPVMDGRTDLVLYSALMNYFNALSYYLCFDHSSLYVRFPSNEQTMKRRKTYIHSTHSDFTFLPLLLNIWKNPTGFKRADTNVDAPTVCWYLVGGERQLLVLLPNQCERTEEGTAEGHGNTLWDSHLPACARHPTLPSTQGNQPTCSPTGPEKGASSDEYRYRQVAALVLTRTFTPGPARFNGAPAKDFGSQLKPSDGQSVDRWQPWPARWPVLLARRLPPSFLSVCAHHFQFFFCAPVSSTPLQLFSPSIGANFFRPRPSSLPSAAVWVFWSNEPGGSQGSFRWVD